MSVAIFMSRIELGRNCWAVIVNGQRHILGEHPDDAPPPRKKSKKWVVPQSIKDRYHDLRHSLRGKPAGLVAAKPALSVGDVFEKFLAWCRQRVNVLSPEVQRQVPAPQVAAEATKVLTGVSDELQVR